MGIPFLPGGRIRERGGGPSRSGSWPSPSSRIARAGSATRRTAAGRARPARIPASACRAAASLCRILPRSFASRLREDHVLAGAQWMEERFIEQAIYLALDGVVRIEKLGQHVAHRDDHAA